MSIKIGIPFLSEEIIKLPLLLGEGWGGVSSVSLFVGESKGEVRFMYVNKNVCTNQRFFLTNEIEYYYFIDGEGSRIANLISYHMVGATFRLRSLNTQT